MTAIDTIEGQQSAENLAPLHQQRPGGRPVEANQGGDDISVSCRRQGTLGLDSRGHEGEGAAQPLAQVPGLQAAVRGRDGQKKNLKLPLPKATRPIRINNRSPKKAKIGPCQSHSSANWGLARCGKTLGTRVERAGLQPRRKARPKHFNNLHRGRRSGGAEAPPFRGPKLRFRSLPGARAQVPGVRC